LCSSAPRLRVLDDDSAHMCRCFVAIGADPFLGKPVLHPPPAPACRAGLWLCGAIRFGVASSSHFLRLIYPRRHICAVIVSPWCREALRGRPVAPWRPRPVPLSTASMPRSPRIQYLWGSAAENCRRICPLPRFVCPPAVLTLGSFCITRRRCSALGTGAAALSPLPAWSPPWTTPAPARGRYRPRGRRRSAPPRRRPLRSIRPAA